MIQKLDIKYLNESHQGGHFRHLMCCNINSSQGKPNTVPFGTDPLLVMGFNPILIFTAFNPIHPFPIVQIPLNSITNSGFKI